MSIHTYTKKEIFDTIVNRQEKWNIIRDYINIPKIENKIDLSEFQFNNLTIKNLNFKDCHFQLTEFINCHFDNCDFSHSMGDFKINDSIFENCRFENINFPFTNINFTKFKNCHFEDIEFYDIELKNVEFKNCTIKHVIFEESEIQIVSIIESKMEHVDFRKSNINFKLFIKNKCSFFDINDCLVYITNMSNCNIISSDWRKSAICSSHFYMNKFNFLKMYDIKILYSKFEMNYFIACKILDCSIDKTIHFSSIFKSSIINYSTFIDSEFNDIHVLDHNSTFEYNDILMGNKKLLKNVTNEFVNLQKFIYLIK